ncbi:thymidylate kinase [Candidatus Woesearchaeota archaeon]|nr:thymidylate kinase [Candidatus Woesearchaeota archaeon]
MLKNRFVMVDGLDGSGKGTIVDALQKWAELKGMKVLDLRSYCREKNTFPEPEEALQYDAVVSAEPTFCYVGKAIREELVRALDRRYSAITLAQAFALDREMLYKRVLIPAIKAGKYVFQERGLSSSLVYQPVQEHIQLSELIKLPGNRTALQFAPNLFIIATVRPETVIKRLGTREKKDYSIFDNLSFQRNVDSRFRSDWLRQLFEQHGSKVVYLNTDEPKTAEDTQKEAVTVFEGFMAGNAKQD